MGADNIEARKRGQSPAKKSTVHRYAAVEHRVLDSEAFADLSFSAQSLLTLMCRQLSIDNNGHLQATHSYMQRFGFSDRTLTRATKELVEHGFLYRTRMGGYQKGASQYAVTWLPIKKREGLNLEWFISCAWHKWKPDEKKLPPANLRASNRKNGELPHIATAKITAEVGAKFTHNETVPVVDVKTPLYRAAIHRPHRHRTAANPIRPRLNRERQLLRQFTQGAMLAGLVSGMPKSNRLSFQWGQA